MYRLFHYLLIWLFLISCIRKPDSVIDRHAVVNRHNVVITSIDSLNPLTVGNGDFAFTVDITGLQTFPEVYFKGIPLGTLSNWGWHSYPNVNKYNPDQVIRNFIVGGKEVGYYHDFRGEQSAERAKASAWLRENPHRWNLGMIGLKLYNEDKQLISISDIKEPFQELHLWRGEIRSYFEVMDMPVEVVTICHPEKDLVAVNITSELVKTGRLEVELRFPEADPGWKNSIIWGDPLNHESRILDAGSNNSIIEHVQDSARCTVNVSHSSGEVIAGDAHRFILVPSREEATISFSCEYGKHAGNTDSGPVFDNIQNLASSYWESFWRSGGVVDFSECTDERAFELERRVVLSQYLTNVQCSGALPPQETGLTFNSWHGKFHLEMHWWHGVHFALWQRGKVLERQMPYYSSINVQARELAKFQGYKGVRWPKMIGPGGLTSPSTVGNYLIWQQPHYIYFAELLYQTSNDTLSVLREYSDQVYETADFMASFPEFDSVSNRYILAPPLISAQETFDVNTTINPTFELIYWNWGLNTAIKWKHRMEEQVPREWTDVVERLSKPSVRDSVYQFAENATDSYTNPRYLSDHPMILGCVGMLPPSGFVDPGIMQNSFDRVVSSWNWTSSWGWDFPMVAMSAGALGRYDKAVDFLLMDTQKNTYLSNGHNYQDERLTLYLPGNGGLLTAVATMCTKDQFPKNGAWNVRWENLNDF